jgi:serine/threonine-protein kinase
VKVTDFGIARAEAGEPLTKTGAVLGTATYFSPEQAQGFPLDGRSDVYALGVVLYEMLTGVAPFTAESPVSVAYKHVREAPAPPTSLVPDLPGAIDRIVLTALAKDVDARYPSAQDLRADLLRFERGRPLVGVPVTAASPTPTSVLVAAPLAPAPVAAAPRPAPPRRKSRWGAAVVIAIALGLLVAMIVFLIANSDFGDEGAATPTLDVPGVTGLGFSQAEKGLMALGFTVAREDVDQPEQPPEVVLGQTPEAGRKIPKGGLVTLRVSSPTITVPNVVGQTRAQAMQTLSARNLNPTFVEEDSDQPPGTVLRTDPAADGQAAKPLQGGPAPVSVVIAREPLVPVPDVTNQDPGAALATLGQAGFQVTQSEVASDTVREGAVIGTDPPIGTPLPRGAAVRLLVSSGPALVDVPNMINQPRATAEAVLHDQLGFGLTITLQDAGPTKKGLVVGQSPAGGEAPRGSGIALIVGL